MSERVLTIAFRCPFDSRDWTEYVDWPEGWPVPRVGEMVEIEHGQFHVREVQWFAVPEAGSPPEIQVIIGD